MLFEFLANATFVIHGVFVLLIIPSTVLALVGVYRSWRVLWGLHNVCIAIMAAGQLRFGRCPLVELEEALRNRAGTEMWYEGGFVRYVVGETAGLGLPLGSVGIASLVIVLVSIVAIARHASPGNNPLTA